MDDKDLSFEMIDELINKRDAEEKKDRRRKKPDAIGRMTTILSLGAWAVMIAVWVVLETASPERGMRFTQSFFEVTFGVDSTATLRTRWDYTMVYIAYVLQLVSVGLCLVAFVLNKMRMRRKGDKYKKHIFVIGGITIIAFIFFLIRFWPVLF